VPQDPYLDYAFYYRKLNYDDNVWARRNFQASIAHRYMPNAIAQMNQSVGGKGAIGSVSSCTAPPSALRQGRVFGPRPHRGEPVRSRTHGSGRGSA